MNDPSSTPAARDLQGNGDRKPYATPALVELGNVAALTLAGGATVHDGGTNFAKSSGPH